MLTANNYKFGDQITADTPHIRPLYADLFAVAHSTLGFKS